MRHTVTLLDLRRLCQSESDVTHGNFIAEAPGRCRHTLRQPGVDFTNILLEDFTGADPKSAKNTDDLTVFFCAFGICANKSFE
jgi:hypothetical protein